METSKCEDTEDESILEVSEFDWATYLGVIQYLRRQTISLFLPPTYLNVDNIYPPKDPKYFWRGTNRFGQVQFVLDGSKFQKLVQKNIIYTSPKMI